MTHDVPAYGLWLVALVNAAVFTLFAFSFLRPKTAPDWRSLAVNTGVSRNARSAKCWRHSASATATTRTAFQPSFPT